MIPGSEKNSPIPNARWIIGRLFSQFLYRCTTAINHRVSTTKQVDENAG